MIKAEALKKLEGKTGPGKWLYQKMTGEFAILNSYSDPKYLKKAIYLFTNEQIEAAAEWMAEATA
jgi:hypothetical protein